MSSFVTPAGFRPPLQAPSLHRGNVIPFRKRLQGLGDAGSSYAAIASQLTPGSAMQQFFSGCAQNPTPACAANAPEALGTPYLTGAQSTVAQEAIASGAPIPTMQAITGAPPGTQLPVTTFSSSPSGGDQLQGTLQATPLVRALPLRIGPAFTPRSNTPAVQAVQPAGAPSPTDTSSTTTTSPSFLAQTLLGFPMWLWLTAGVGGYFLFAGGQHGR